MGEDVVVLTGEALDCAQVQVVARMGGSVKISDAGLARAYAAHIMVDQLLTERPIYGRSTGVGANRDVDVPDPAGHGVRLLRSHCGGAGPLLPTEVARAMLLVRLNQLAVGGSGVDPALLTALATALNLGLSPPVHRYGAIGTGDLAALAGTALCLLGERDWHGGTMAPYRIEDTDALAFLSSNAATLGQAALASHDLTALLSASLTVAALSLVAIGASPEPLHPAVQLARGHPGQRRAAQAVRTLLGDGSGPGRRIQDPYGFRVLPQVHGAALDAAGHLDQVLRIELNSASENPLIDADERDVWHNGNFHAAELALALDTARLALVPAAALSAARLSTVLNPAFTGLPPFLADGPPGSSGLMILEYVAHDALADLRHFAGPAVLASAVVSLGVEDHASFAPVAARRTADTVAAYPVLLACELIAAVRAIRLGDLAVPVPLRAVLDRLSPLDPDPRDRPLDADLATAITLLPTLADPTP